MIAVSGGFGRDDGGWRRLLRVAVSVWAVGSPAGCVGPVTDVLLNTQAAAERADTYDDRPWATVLRENVKDELVDYVHLAAHREPLDEYLTMLRDLGPTARNDLFPTRDSRVCYYINAYNAGVLAAVLHAGAPATIHSPRFGTIDTRFRLWVDGRPLRLAELRRSALRESGGDLRVMFALCDGARGSPPLHDQPLRPEGLEETLRLMARRVMDDHHHVSVDHERQALLVSALLATRRSEFIAYFERQTGASGGTMLNVVLYFARPVRRQWLNTAVGYSERMIPFDRRLNRIED